MKRQQIYPLVNDIFKEILGTSIILEEDLSNVVDCGKALLDATDVDNYVNALIDKVGKQVFVDRKYESSLPSIMFESWEFGSVLEKSYCVMPRTSANESWELSDGHTYSQEVFYKPTIHSKLYNKRVTFEVDLSITDLQAKTSLKDANALTSFVSMIYTAIENAVTVGIDEACKRVVNNLIAEVYTDGVSGVSKINLLKTYNDTYNKSLTTATMFGDGDFLRWCVYIIGEVSERMTKVSTLYNVGRVERFTPKTEQKFVMLGDFDRAIKVNLYNGNGQYLNEYLTVPNHDSVPYWQGSGTTYAFDDISKIKVKVGSDSAQVEANGILGVMFDRNAVGVSCLDRRTRSVYNAKAEFTNVYDKVDLGEFCDLDENAVVFYASAT